MEYTFLDHLHNYAVWTAARAAQRGFTTTENIKSAIDQTPLRNLVEKNRSMTSAEFDEFHAETANAIMRYLAGKGIETTYGRAAKIIAVYLKTTVVIRDSGESVLAKTVHPPIDNILLTKLNAKDKELGLKDMRWTKLDERDYFDLIRKLRTLGFDSFWKIEEFWTGIQ